MYGKGPFLRLADPGSWLNPQESGLRMQKASSEFTQKEGKNFAYRIYDAKFYKIEDVQIQTLV